MAAVKGLAVHGLLVSAAVMQQKLPLTPLLQVLCMSGGRLRRFQICGVLFACTYRNISYYSAPPSGQAEQILQDPF